MAFPTIDLRGRRALVTGGSRGLGRAIATSLAAAGARVAVVSRNEEQARAAARSIVEEIGGSAIGFAADVRQVSSIQEMVGRAARELGGLEILVNNAGVAVTTRALDVTEDEWDDVLTTNLKAVFFASQAAARHMKDHGGGVIVNVSSIAGFVGERAIAPYCASKGGVNNLTRALALEWARFGIRVVGVAPGYVETSLNRDAFRSNPRLHEHVLGKTPLRRLGTPNEVGAAVAYLASDLAAYVTGEILVLDGGWLAE